MKSIRESGRAVGLLTLLLFLSVVGHAAVGPYGPVPMAPHGVQVAWVCRYEPLVNVPAPTNPWGTQYRMPSSPYNSAGFYRSHFDPAGILPAASQPQPISYPLVHRCRLQVVVPGQSG